MLKDITILIAAYNCQNYLYDAVLSVASRHDLSVKVIIIDDCSTDKTQSISESILTKFKNIKYIRNEINLGYPASLNKALQLVDTDFVGILDGDDIAINNWPEPQLRLINEFGADLCGSGGLIVDIEGVSTGLKVFDNKMKVEDVTREIKKCKYLFLHSGVVYKVNTVKNFGMYNPVLKSMEDWDLFLSTSYCGKIIHSGLVAIKYRRKPGSESQKTKDFISLSNQYMLKKSRLLSEGMIFSDVKVELNALEHEITQIKRIIELERYFYYLDLSWCARNSGYYVRSIKFLRKALMHGLPRLKALLEFTKILLCFFVRRAY